MKKLEQSILVMLIITCIGMCFGSILIAFQRNKENTNEPEDRVNQIFFRPSEEDEINRLLQEQVYPALMHHQQFPSSLFQSTSQLVHTEEDRFYFVFEMMRTGITKDVVCDSSSEGISENQCRVLISDFQDFAMNIFGRRIQMSLISNDLIYQIGNYLYVDYISNFVPSFVLRFSSLTEKNGVYDLTLDFYTSLENGSVNYRDVGSWSVSTLISQKYLFGNIHFSYQIQDNHKIITAVSFTRL